MKTMEECLLLLEKKKKNKKLEFLSYLRAKEIIKYIYENRGGLTEIEGYPTDSSYNQELVLIWDMQLEFYIKRMSIELDKWGNWFAEFYLAGKFELKYHNEIKHTYKILTADAFESHSKINQIKESIHFMNES